MQRRIQELLTELDPAIRQTCTSAELIYSPYFNRATLQDFRLPDKSFASLQDLDHHPLIIKLRGQSATAPLVKVELAFAEVTWSSELQDPTTPDFVEAETRRFDTLGDSLLFAQQIEQKKKRYLHVVAEWAIEEEGKKKSFDVQVVIYFAQDADYNLNTHLL